MAACTTPVRFQSLGNLPFSLHNSSRSQPPLSISNPHVLSFLPHGFRSEESTFRNLRPFPKEKMGGGAGRGKGMERKARNSFWKCKICHIPPRPQVSSRDRPQSARRGAHPVFSFCPRCCPSSLENTREIGTKLALPLSDLGCSQVSSAP